MLRVVLFFCFFNCTRSKYNQHHSQPNHVCQRRGNQCWGSCYFYCFSCVAGNFIIAITVTQGNLNKFTIKIIIVSNIRGINSIIVSSIGGISVRSISVGVRVFFGVGVNFDFFLQFINEYIR